MIWKEKKIFRKMFIVTEYAALTKSNAKSMTKLMQHNNKINVPSH